VAASRSRREQGAARGVRYAAGLLFTIVVLGSGAAYAMRTLYAAIAHEHPLIKVEGDDQFTVTNPGAVRPRPKAYDAFAREDALWRARNAPPVPWWSLHEGPYVWHKPPRQVVTDSAYALTQRGRLRDAAALLDGWLAVHPEDPDLLLDLARLRNALGDDAAAIRRYRELLALAPNETARGELAAVLLDGRQYTAAAMEYRQLLALRPENRGYRLGLARALLWGEHGREAEAVLRSLALAAPGDTVVRSLLHAARESYDPTADEANRWLLEEPSYTPYRLALARALAAAGRNREAATQFDLVLAADSELSVLREAAAAHGSIGDSTGAARLYGRAVSLAPADDSLRLQYAKALAWAGADGEAIEQYGVLIAHRPSAALLLARGEMYVWRGDYARGVADLRRSVALLPSYDGFALLGDVARWQGRFDESRAMYLRALALVPNDERVMLALADLRRMQTLYIASVGGAEEGWSTTGTYAEDNTGFLFLAGGMSGGVALDSSTVVGIGVEQRRVAQRSLRARTRYIDGFAADVRARRQIGAHLALSANGGIARHALVHDIPFGGIALDWTSGRVSASLSLGRGPVYGSLMSLATLAPSLATPNGSGGPIVGRTATASVSVPIGRAALTVTGERLELSDGNARNLVSAAVRVPLAANVAAIYDGAVLGYAHSSDLYWDPRRYTSQAVGIEISGQPARGLSIAVRALPGIAQSQEPVGTTPAGSAAIVSSRQVFQLSTGGELEYHAARWDATAGAGYGRGRDGDYQSLNGSFRIRVKW
jgi:Flp pilus assembly protein TadD